jgi:pumilio RNA-binding family
VIDRDAILAIVVDSGLLGLSRQKFASNVVEKLLKYGNERHICAIVREMLKVRLRSNSSSRFLDDSSCHSQC